MYILTLKLAQLRPYQPNFVPCSLSNCQIDRFQHHYTKKYFHNIKTPIREIPAALISNSQGWLKIEGTLVDNT